MRDLLNSYMLEIFCHITKYGLEEDIEQLIMFLSLIPFWTVTSVKGKKYMLVS